MNNGGPVFIPNVTALGWLYTGVPASEDVEGILTRGSEPLPHKAQGFVWRTAAAALPPLGKENAY